MRTATHVLCTIPAVVIPGVVLRLHPAAQSKVGNLADQPRAEQHIPGSLPKEEPAPDPGVNKNAN